MKSILNNNSPYKLLLLLLLFSITCISQIQAEHSEDYTLFRTEDICSSEKPEYKDVLGKKIGSIAKLENTKEEITAALIFYNNKISSSDCQSKCKISKLVSLFGDRSYLMNNNEN